MTGRTIYKTRKCISVINNFQEERFTDNSEDLTSDNVDISIFTSIWKDPDRLSFGTDFNLLLAILSREVNLENFTDTLKICKIMKKSSAENRNVDRIFEFLLLQMLKENMQKKIDRHVLLQWLDTGDREFCGDVMTDRAYALWKLYFMCFNWQSKHECSPCGCMQKYSIELYTDKSSARFMMALNSLITFKDLDLHPIVKRLFLALPRISSLEYFEYYIELLEELQTCSVIDISPEKEIQRLIQFIGLLSHLNLDDVPQACSKLNNLIYFEISNAEKKKVPLIENGLRTRLLPKIFDSIGSIHSVRLTLNKKTVEEIVELVSKERYSNAKDLAVFFAPLQLLNRIYQKFDIWEKTWPVIKTRLDSLRMHTPQSTIMVLYCLSLLYRNESSLIKLLVENLGSQYKTGTIKTKRTVLIILEIMEKLGDSNKLFRSFFKENCLRKRLLMDAEMGIALEYLDDFTNIELNQFLQQKLFSDGEFSILIGKLCDTDIVISSDSFWRSLLEKADENSVKLVKNQLKLLVNREDRRSLNLRIDQVFHKIRSTEVSDKSIELLMLEIPSVLLDFSDREYGLLSQTTSVSLFSVLILAYCAVFERNEFQICSLFRKLKSKINKTQCDSSIRDFPIEVMEEICEKIHSRQIPVQFDTSFLSKVFESKPETVQEEERILDVSSVLFGKLASDFQVLSDKIANSPFCQTAKMLSDYVKNSMEEEIVPNFDLFRNVCKKSMEGFAMYTERWNWFFVVPRIIVILAGAKRDINLLRTLMRTINKNQVLYAKLKSRKDFQESEQLISQ